MKKVLVIRNDRFGEFLLNLPAIRAVKESYPGVQLSLAVAPMVEPIAGALPYVDQVLLLAPGRMGVTGMIRFALDLRRKKFDAAIVLNPTAEAHQAVFWAGIPLRVGYSRKYHRLLTHTLKDVKGLGRTHEVLNNLELAALLGCSTSDFSLRFNVPDIVEREALKTWGLERVKPYVVVHPWTSDPVKQWPQERFERLIAVLSGDMSKQVVILGRPEAWHQKLSLPSVNVLDLSGKTTLLESAAVLKHAQVLVSCDSGPVHLAASVGTKCIVLFRNDMPGKNPERWGPWPVDRHCVIQRSCLEDIAVEEVLSLIG